MTSSTGAPSIVTPTARRAPRSTIATICGSAANWSSNGSGLGRGAHDRELPTRVTEAAHVPGGLTAERAGDRVDELPGAVEHQSGPRLGLRVAGELITQLGLDLRPDPGDIAQLAGRGRLAQLVCRADVQRPRNLHRALRAQPEVAAESDQIGRQLALELLQLGDLPGLDELREARLDTGADRAQFAGAPGPHQVGDGHRGATDRLGRAPVRAGRVAVCLRQLEQRRERIEPVSDLAIVHRT